MLNITKLKDLAVNAYKNITTNIYMQNYVRNISTIVNNSMEEIYNILEEDNIRLLLLSHMKEESIFVWIVEIAKEMLYSAFELCLNTTLIALEIGCIVLSPLTAALVTYDQYYYNTVDIEDQHIIPKQITDDTNNSDDNNSIHHDKKYSSEYYYRAYIERISSIPYATVIG